MLAIASSIVLMSWIISPIQAQEAQVEIKLPGLNQLNQDPKNQIDSECIRLDGYCLFRIAAPKSDLPGRVIAIQQSLNKIKRAYLKNNTTQLQIEVRRQAVTNEQPNKVEQQKKEQQDGEEQSKQTPEIYVAVGNQKPERLTIVTSLDADLKSVDVDTAAQLLVEQLEQGLERAKQERQSQSLFRQGAVAIGTGIAILIASVTIYHLGKKLRRSKEELAPANSAPAQPLSAQLNRRQLWNLREVQHRLFQLAQTLLLAGGSLFILSLFPYSRMTQVLILEALQIPLKLGIVALGTYVLIRLSYALINRFTSALARSYLLSSESNQRLQLRVGTVSRVTRSIVTITCIGVGTLVALAAIGMNIGPLLAGVGILGVAVSLASQSLIKDAINGFFIILEDHYAVGDVITMDKVGGLVEHMNLRITQLRDAEGRLITIPNSEIKLVANHSSGWSRVDVSIPIGYQAKAEEALVLIDKVAQEMSNDEKWREQILEKPEVLGIDNFDERGLMIRVWIKTKPLSQWNVAREFRLRVKATLDAAGIQIPSHIDFRTHESLPMKSSQDEPILPPTALHNPGMMKTNDKDEGDEGDKGDKEDNNDQGEDS